MAEHLTINGNSKEEKYLNTFDSTDKKWLEEVAQLFA